MPIPLFSLTLSLHCELLRRDKNICRKHYHITQPIQDNLNPWKKQNNNILYFWCSIYEMAIAYVHVVLDTWVIEIIVQKSVLNGVAI